jgi:hypothetical protein
MPYWVPYLGLAVLPLLVICVGNPLSFAWGFRHGSAPKPPEFVLKVRKVDRYVDTVRDLLLLLVILHLAMRQSLGFAQIGLHLNGWPLNIAIGIAASLIQTGIRYFVMRLLPPRERQSLNSRLLDWPVVHWIGHNLLSVLAQEVWIAFCVLALVRTGHSVAVSLVLVGAFFGASHFEYGFFGAFPTAFGGIASASLFLWRGSLLPSYTFHLIGNMVSLYIARQASRTP